MPTVTKMTVDIVTGDNGADNNTRIFLGFDGYAAREFRLRRDGDNDANPFRQNTHLQLIFGVNSNVRNPKLNDPANPYPIDSNSLWSAYIHYPQSDKSWSLDKATVQLFSDPGGGTLEYSFNLQAPITLEEDAGEWVNLV
jgi:hypothetical protein